MKAPKAEDHLPIALENTVHDSAQTTVPALQGQDQTSDFTIELKFARVFVIYGCLHILLGALEISLNIATNVVGGNNSGFAVPGYIGGAWVISVLIQAIAAGVIGVRTWTSRTQSQTRRYLGLSVVSALTSVGVLVCGALGMSRDLDCAEHVECYELYDTSASFLINVWMMNAGIFEIAISIFTAITTGWLLWRSLVDAQVQSTACFYNPTIDDMDVSQAVTIGGATPRAPPTMMSDSPPPPYDTVY